MENTENNYPDVKKVTYKHDGIEYSTVKEIFDIVEKQIKEKGYTVADALGQFTIVVYTGDGERKEVWTKNFIIPEMV